MKKLNRKKTKETQRENKLEGRPQPAQTFKNQVLSQYEGP